MALESVSLISDLNEANPTSVDPVKQGDDHIRNIKKALKNTFANVSAAILATAAEINFLQGVTSSIQTQLNARALASRTISSGSGLTGGGSLEANRTIAHADTSSQGSVNNSGATVVQDVTLDGFGHVTSLGSKALTYADVNALRSNGDAETSAGAGYSQTYFDHGTNGTRTLNYTYGNYQYVERTGSLSIVGGTTGSANTVVLMVVNNGSPSGSVNLSGFNAITGDSFDNSSNGRWMLHQTRIGAWKHAHVVKVA